MNFLTFEDGDKVFLQTVYNFAGAGEQVGFDVFRFDADGKIAEHWDNLAGGSKSSSGRLFCADRNGMERLKMQISSRFTVALHIFTCVDTFKDEHKVTSDFLAASINTNPVIIRKILTQLKNAGLINVIRGTGGIELTRDLKDITFYDVYQAIEPLEDGDLFRFHESPNPECPVGRNIHSLLDDKLKNIQEAMESEMKKYTLNDLRSGMQELLAKEA